MLPKPGAWMERLKQFLAFPLYATVAWLAWVLGAQVDNDAVVRLLVTLVVVAFALWARLIRFEYALVVTAATAAVTLAYASTEPYSAIITVSLPPVLVLTWSSLRTTAPGGRAGIVGAGIFLGVTATFYTLLFGLAANRPNPAALKVVGKFLTTEPLAIMLPRSDPEFKKVADDEMRRLITSGQITPIYDKWFAKPIPPKNTPLNLPVSYLLRDFWKYPTDQVPF